MTARAGKLERQRQRIRVLLDTDPERSATSIAKEIGCGVHTVERVRERHLPQQGVNGTPAMAHPGSANLLPPAEPGNARATKHGAYSEARRAPLEQQHRERLRAEFPSARDDLINSAAKRAAMIDLFSGWCEDVASCIRATVCRT